MTGTLTAPVPVRWARRNRGVLGVVVAVLACVTLLSVLAVRSAGHREDLDPENPGPDGAQAVARVLAAQGVQLTVVRRAAELERTNVDADTTVVVTSSEHLGRSTAREVQERTAAAGTLVLAAPVATLRRALALPVTVEDARPAGRSSASCADDLLGGLILDVGDSPGYRSDDPRVTTCFARQSDPQAGLVARIDGAGNPATYVVGGTDLFTNGRVERADNAAAALRLLGSHQRLVWYVPDVRDVGAGDAGPLAGQLPGGLFPALWLLLAAVLATMVWRGRRLGPLVVEPLPVVVKAVESTQGRGRLYRRVRDRSHAAEILRAATRRRFVARLGLPPDIGVDGLASAVAVATGADPATVLELLATGPVTDDGSLTRLADALSALEREVHP